MNYTTARDSFALSPKERVKLLKLPAHERKENPHARVMCFKGSMKAGDLRSTKQPHRTYRVPRIFNDISGRSEIELRILARRERRLAVYHGGMPHEQPPLFTQALQRALPRGIARGLAKTITRFGSLLTFSKKARILAGKR